MLKVLLLAMVLVLIAIAIMGFRVFFMKDKKFPETEVGHNKEMRKRKIYCAKASDKIERKKTQPHLTTSD